MLELWIEGSIEQAAEVANSGLAAAIATNPSIMERWTAAGRTLESTVREICERVDVPVYVQLQGPTLDDFLYEMERLRTISLQIQPKLIATLPGIRATKRFADEGLQPLVTTVATISQAFLAASAGAAYVAPYVGRIEDAGVDAYALVSDIARLYAQHNVRTRIAAASIRSAQQAESVLRAGAPIIVTQYDVFQTLLQSQMTQNWIDRFDDNWTRIPYEAASGKPTENPVMGD